MSDPVLRMSGVRAGYGPIEVLHGVDLTIPPASVVALLGPNGAGKTTLLRVASGEITPQAGCVHVAGVHVNGMPPELLARAGVCTVPEGRGVFPNLTVEENLRIFAADAPPHQVRERVHSAFPELQGRERQLAGTLSGGEQQMLALTRALVARPPLLLVDELSMGLAPLVVDRLYAAVAGLARDGSAVLVVEQFARTALAVADIAAILVNGHIRSVGEAADIAPELAAAYLAGTR